MRRILIIAAVAWVVLFAVGVDLLHCFLILAAVIAVGVGIEALGAQPAEPADLEPLRVPYRMSMIRSFAVPNVRRSDPVGGTAGSWAATVCRQALIDFPGDPVLAPLADRETADWRYLTQTQLVEMLDRIDQLTATAATSTNPARAQPR